MIGVDIETHDWKNTSGEKGGYGYFGFYTRCNSLDHDARIVKLGWVVHDGHSDAIAPTVQERIVKPEGFEISVKAAGYHGVTQAHANRCGQLIRSVLEDFMEDLAFACGRGGQIVTHNLEFKCGIINNELARAGLESLQPKLRGIARRGVCMMDPDIGKWVRLCLGRQLSTSYGGNSMSLTEMVSGLVMGGDSLRKGAYMHVMLYRSLRKLAHTKLGETSDHTGS